MTRPLPPSATRAASFAMVAYANTLTCPLGGPGLKPADLTVPPHRRGGHHDRRMVQAPFVCPPNVVLRPVVGPLPAGAVELHPHRVARTAPPAGQPARDMAPVTPALLGELRPYERRRVATRIIEATPDVPAPVAPARRPQNRCVDCNVFVSRKALRCPPCAFQRESAAQNRRVRAKRGAA